MLPHLDSIVISLLVVGHGRSSSVIGSLNDPGCFDEVIAQASASLKRRFTGNATAHKECQEVKSSVGERVSLVMFSA